VAGAARPDGARAALANRRRERSVGRLGNARRSETGMAGAAALVKRAAKNVVITRSVMKAHHAERDDYDQDDNSCLRAASVRRPQLESGCPSVQPDMSWAGRSPARPSGRGEW